MSDTLRVLAMIENCDRAQHGLVTRTPCVPCIVKMLTREREAVCAYIESFPEYGELANIIRAGVHASA